MNALLLLIATLTVSANINAGEFYSVKSIWGGTSPSYAPGDIVYCSGLETERKITLGCVNLNVMKGYTVKTDTDGKVVVRSLDNESSVTVGQVNASAGQFILDEITSGYMNKVSLNIESAKLEGNILVRKKLSLNDKVGCEGVFDCDWRVLYMASRVSLEVKLNNQRLEKVPLN